MAPTSSQRKQDKRLKAKQYALIRFGAVCIWCKKIDTVEKLTLEHITRTKLALSCKNCNNKHGGLKSIFMNYVNGLGYNKYLNRLTRFIEKYKLHYILNHSLLEESLSEFKNSPRFKHNPYRIWISPYKYTMRPVDLADVFFENPTFNKPYHGQAQVKKGAKGKYWALYL